MGNFTIQTANWELIFSKYLEGPTDIAYSLAKALDCKIEDLRYLDTEQEDGYSQYDYVRDNSTDGLEFKGLNGELLSWGTTEEGLKIIFSNQWGYGMITTTKQLIESL